MLEIFGLGRTRVTVDTSVRVKVGEASWADGILKNHYRGDAVKFNPEVLRALKALAAYVEIQEAKDSLHTLLRPTIHAAIQSKAKANITGNGVKIEIGPATKSGDITCVPVALYSKATNTGVTMSWTSPGHLTFERMEDTRDRLMSLFKGAIQAATKQS